MQVKKIEESEWRNFLDNCPNATFFHTPEWHLVWKKYAGYNFEAKVFTFKNGKKVLFPVCWRKRMFGLMREYISGPVGTYGGLLSHENLSDSEKKTVQNYFQKIKLLQIRDNPLNDLIDFSFFTKKDSTQLIRLDDSLEGITKKWSDNHIRSLKKGLKNNLFIKEAIQLNEWKTYFEVYQDSLRRWGNKVSSRYEWNLFDLLRQLDPKNCKLWLIKNDEKVLSGCICFYFNNHVVYWHGASLEAFFSLKPVHVLHYEIIKHAIENNFKYYDFNPSGGHEGVEQFKKGFGTVTLAANVYIKKPVLIEKIFSLGRMLRK